MALSQFQATGSPAAQGTYACAAGVAGVVNVPAGAYLVGLTAWATAAGATAQVGALAVVTVPTGGAFGQDVQGGVLGPVAVTFVGTSQYFVEWIIP